MGATMSAGEDNEELVNNLIHANYIKTPLIERVFRAVDRGHYFLQNEPYTSAYRDVAWKSGNYHISSPSIYSEVLEQLRIQPGQSFLNIGSGTGYLSTMVGLILGADGVNHGIECHADVVHYAHVKLDEFKRYSGALDEFEFCEPRFVCGNAFTMGDNNGFHYDRIYCGAACPTELLTHFKTLLNIGGVLVVPVNEQLLEYHRTDETNWVSSSLLPFFSVSFASLIVPAKDTKSSVHIDYERATNSLQEICKWKIRGILKKCIEDEFQSVKDSSRNPEGPKRRRLSKRDQTEEESPNWNKNLPNDFLLDYCVLAVNKIKNAAQNFNNNSNEEDSQMATSANEEDHRSNRKITEPSSSSSTSTTPPSTTSTSSSTTTSSEEEDAVINNTIKTTKNTDENSNDGDNDDDDDEEIEVNRHQIQRRRKKYDSGLGDEDEIINEINTASTSQINEESCLVLEVDEDNSNDDNILNNDDDDDEDEDDSTSTTTPATLSSDSSPSRSSNEGMDSMWEFFKEFPSMKAAENKVKRRVAGRRRRVLNKQHSGDTAATATASTLYKKMYKSPYTEPMLEKIKMLPLPIILKRYLNLNRDI